ASTSVSSVFKDLCVLCSVTPGDILGRAMKNLDGLLQMPYGCGEQNMALLAPNIYILQYLQDTQQLSPEVKERAFKFLSSGYQRQLNYKHEDGSYSAFGHGDGNTWLTTFVLRSFSKASKFVYIDPQKLDQSREWLQSRQVRTAASCHQGNSSTTGGVSDNVTLSAYITAAFLEMNMSTTDPVLQESLSCLKNHTENMENVYTTALMAYVFSLAGDTETRAQLLKRLHSQAHEGGGFLHWSAASSASLSVETSAYVLLSTLTQPQVSVEELGYASKIVRWLTGQQNPYGGFKSTQDTVVALQALALYSTLVYSPDGSSSVVVQAPPGATDPSMSFTVDQSNKLLYQERPLESAVGQYGLEVTGSTCASVQISTHYNIPTPRDEQSVGVKAEAHMKCDSTVLTYFGEQSSSNMIILDVKMLSGFGPGFLNEDLVDRVEQKDDHILIYIREVSYLCVFTAFK
uniref:Alpha-macroglobulin receptor-binding domain-containing protein n=1 Tax=Neogobius melanostomus TaxID=47308 RepID=A0A8C6WFQ8_9GOBI